MFKVNYDSIRLGSRREIKARGCDATRMNALEQLKKARQGGQSAVIEEVNKQTADQVEDEVEGEEEEEDDYESDMDDYEEIRSSTKRKSNNTHRKDTKRLKKKARHSSSDEGEREAKASEPKRRGQVFAKQDEETKGMQDIKSMFAVNKTRNIQKQEQVNLSIFHFENFSFFFSKSRIKKMNPINCFLILCSSCKNPNKNQ